MDTPIPRFGISRLIALPLGLWSLGCGGDGPPTTVTEPPVTWTITRVSGDDQDGRAGSLLEQPLVVRLVDPAGDRLGNLSVTWAVTSGTGRFMDSNKPEAETVTTITNRRGLTGVEFRPTALGPIEVTASSANGDSATFVTEVNTLVMHWYGEFFGPNGARDVEIPLGVAVEWERWGASMPMQIRATEVPPGGESFDTVDADGGLFRFVPGVTGTWKYLVEYPGSDYVDEYFFTVR